MKKKLAFLFSTFLFTTLMMAVQKPIFLLYYVDSSSACSWQELLGVVWHGLSLDLTVAGYVTALPVVVVLVSLWVTLSGSFMRRFFMTYFTLVSVVASLIFAVDIALYEHWGFRIDSTILIYLSDPKDAMASVDWGLGVRQTLFFAACAVIMCYGYHRVLRFFTGESYPWRKALPWSVAVVLLAGFDFLAIRGGVGASTANVSKVCFSSNLFLNHAAVNPVFSFLSSLGKSEDYGAMYRFFSEEECAARFDAIRGNRPGADAPSEQLLTTPRPNVVVILLESFARTVMDATAEGKAVMPHMQRLKGEGVWFENMFANSFRTDRGEVAVLSGFPAQTRHSIMKMATRCSSLPSVARSLAAAGYRTSFTYGGDLNFTNQASYMYATGWQELFWQKNLSFATPPADWGYDDRVMCDYFADRIVELDREGKPFLAGFLTLSSHVPFDVPYDKFTDRELNAFAFSDECVGQMIDRLKQTAAWKNLLVVLVADHGFPYPKTLAYNVPLRHRIPMIWTGGAVREPRVVETYASQTDICATLLSQMGLPHDDFDYSKDIFSPSLPKFGYYAFNDGFGVVDSTGSVIWDATTGPAPDSTAPQLLDVGKTMLQTTYTDISRR